MTGTATVPIFRYVPSPAVSLPCIWCLREQGLPAGAGSHGICIPHKNAVLAQYREKHGTGNTPMITTPTVTNNQAVSDTQEEESIPLSDHSGSGFCYNSNCSCRTNQSLISTLIGHVQRGTASVNDMTRIYEGKTI